MLSSFARRSFAASQVSKLQPLWDFVLIERLTTPVKTPGGLFVPDALRGKQNQGLVLAAGPGVRDKKGNYQPLTLKKGDLVVLADWSANEVKFDGKEYMLLRESDVLGILTQ
jgi:chaperonin GroES